jgi:hypothetical protein
MTELSCEYCKSEATVGLSKSLEIDFRYIYCLKNTDNNRKTYFLTEEDTHFAFAFPYLKVGLVRVVVDSPEYAIAVENSYKARAGFRVK